MLVILQLSNPNAAAQSSAPAWPLYNAETELFLCLSTPDAVVSHHLNKEIEMETKTGSEHVAGSSAGVASSSPQLDLTCAASNAISKQCSRSGEPKAPPARDV